MDIQIKYGPSLSPEAFDSILALDRKAFGDDILTNQGMALKRFMKFKDSMIAAYSGDTLMGFICFFSVNPSVYERAASGEYIDDNLSERDVKPLTKERGNDILLFDHVIDEPFRSHGISALLLDSVRDYLRQRHQEGYEIDRVFGYTITPKGYAILSSFGSRELWIRDTITFMEINKELFLRLL